MTALKRRFLFGLSQRRHEHSLGSYVFSLSPSLLRTGLAAHKTSQHHLDVAVDGFIPVRCKGSH